MLSMTPRAPFVMSCSVQRFCVIRTGMLIASSRVIGSSLLSGLLLIAQVQTAASSIAFNDL